MCCNVVLKKKKKSQPRLQTATLILSMSLQLQRYFEKSMISRKVSLICTYVLISPSYKCCSVLREICRESNWILCMCPLSVAGRLCGEVRWVRRESPRSEWLQQGEPTHRGLKPLPSDATEQPGRCDRSEGRYFCQTHLEDGHCHRHVASSVERNWILFSHEKTYSFVFKFYLFRDRCASKA